MSSVEEVEKEARREKEVGNYARGGRVRLLESQQSDATPHFASTLHQVCF